MPDENNEIHAAFVFNLVPKYPWSIVSKSIIEMHFKTYEYLTIVNPT